MTEPSPSLRRVQIALIGALVAFAASALAILKLASEILEGELDALDRSALVWIRSELGSIGWLRSAMLDLTALGDTVTLFLVGIIATGLFATTGARRLAWFFPLHALAGGAIVRTLKILVDRGRPDGIAHWTTFSTASFPSGHAASSAIVYLSLAVLAAEWLPNRTSRIFITSAAMALALAIGFSRLYLGVHWPTDVLAGWMLGGGWAVLGWAVHRRLAQVNPARNPA